jgi:hypothetical protein
VYASGDQATLNRFLAPGASVGGLGGAVSFGSIASLTVPRGGATRDIAVTVNWALSGQVSQAAPQFAATYDISLIDQQSRRWYADTTVGTRAQSDRSLVTRPLNVGHAARRQKQVSEMGTAEAVFAILSASATALGVLGGLLWWVYKRGQASGAEKAKREALEQVVAEIRTQLSATQPKRRRP